MYHNMLQLFVRLQAEATGFLRREEGQGITEYVFILGFVVLVLALVLTQTNIAGAVSSKLSSIAAGI